MICFVQNHRMLPRSVDASLLRRASVVSVQCQWFQRPCCTRRQDRIRLLSTTAAASASEPGSGGGGGGVAAERARRGGRASRARLQKKIGGGPAGPDTGGGGRVGRPPKAANPTLPRPPVSITKRSLERRMTCPPQIAN